LRAVIVLLILLFTSACSGRGIGFVVAIWPPEESSLKSGDIVKVISESEIRDLFIIENKEKIPEEIPRSAGRFFTRKKSAEQFLGQYGPYIDMYAYSEISLNVRSAPTSTASREYRLRPGQIVKVINKLSEPYTVGSSAGHWIEVLTESGFSGFCFDRHLTLFERDSLAFRRNSEEELLKSLFSNRWYPSTYLDMINSERISIERLRSGEGFFPDKDNKKLVIRAERERVEFSFTDISFLGRSAIFVDSPAEVIFYSPERIYVKYTHRGVDHLSFYTVLEKSIDEYVQEEISRRNNAVDLFLRRGNHLVSDLYGSITMRERGRFTWTGYENLITEVIPFDYGSSGTIRNNYHLSRRVDGRFDGVFSFAFESTGKEIVLVYNFVDAGIRFTHVPERNIENLVVTSVPADAHVLYFRQSSLPQERVR